MSQAQTQITQKKKTPVALIIVICVIVVIGLLPFILPKLHLNGNLAEKCWVEGDCSYEHENRFYKEEKEKLSKYGYRIVEKGYHNEYHYIKLELNNGKSFYFFFKPSYLDVSASYGYWRELGGEKYSKVETLLEVL